MLAQVLAVTIFLVMFILIVTEIWERHIITIVSAVLTLLLVFGLGMRSFPAALATLNLESMIHSSFWISTGEHAGHSSGINWETIVFIFGMMIMVEGMALSGFFRWLCMRIAKLVNYKVVSIFITFMILSAFLAMFIDSITVILFLAAVTIELSQLLNFNPVPLILSEIFCANLGGSATMCGDPPNIIIGTSFNYSFTDFITNTGVIAAISLIFTIIYFYFVFHKDLENSGKNIDPSTFPTPESAITNKFNFIFSTIVFLCAIILLVTHAQTGLTVSFIGTVIAIVTLIGAGKNAVLLVKKVDYKTLIFFIGLFVVVGGLEQTGILEILAQLIGRLSGGNVKTMIAIIIWISAICSAFIDNIPFAATMIPVIKSLSIAHGIPLTTLSWTLAMGTDIGGSATPIGASANVVGIATAAKSGHIIKWGKYCKIMAPITILVIFVSMFSIYLRYF